MSELVDKNFVENVELNENHSIQTTIQEDIDNLEEAGSGIQKAATDDEEGEPSEPSESTKNSGCQPVRESPELGETVRLPARNTPLEDITESIHANPGENFNQPEISTDDNDGKVKPSCSITSPPPDKLRLRKRQNLENLEVNECLKPKRSRRRGRNKSTRHSQIARSLQQQRLKSQRKSRRKSSVNRKNSTEAVIPPATVENADVQPRPGREVGGKGKKKRSPTTAFIFNPSEEQEANPVGKPPLAVLFDRVLSGQYVKIRKLSGRRIEHSLGCSLADYLREEGRLSLTEALRSSDYRGVELTAREEELLSLLRDKEVPQPLPLPPLSPGLNCALCQEEFEDFDSRAAHYSLHIKGQVGASSPLLTFPCALCEVQCRSVEDRRDHYQLIHCPPQSTFSSSSSSSNFGR